MAKVNYFGGTFSGKRGKIKKKNCIIFYKVFLPLRVIQKTGLTDGEK